MTFFPDAQHVDAVRRALWSNRGSGKAVAMVGAGMSLNATAKRPGISRMPTWKQLVSVMIDRLYPADGGNQKRRNALTKEAGATSVALRLADEFAAAFGRSALDELILEHTPDRDFVPGSLHRLLVELPWADILTTNYDTLLERAAEEGYGRKYSVINSPAEIPSSSRPRIIKLHGSFPSNRPFVFGEEDFRTYPQRFASFVNLARQIVLENVVCLIGFKGDDPNFLAWTGWVRDQLAEYSPRIYLCDLLELTNAQRAVLKNRGVEPIDLSPVFPSDTDLDSGVRYRKALECFFVNLRQGKPYDPKDWPKVPAATEVSKKTTFLLGVSAQEFPFDEPHPSSDSGSSEEKGPKEILEKQTEIWAHNRKLYPGWVIAPPKIRSWIFSQTDDRWQTYYLENRKALNPVTDLKCLYELNWRLEKSLQPIWDNLVPAYEQTLVAINPFPNQVIDLGSFSITPESPGEYRPDWKVIREQWLEIACGLLRYYREERKWTEFERWEKRITLTADDLPDIQARLCHERSLRGFANLDDDAVQANLAVWPLETNDPIWSIRKAGVLAELGQTQNAASLANMSLVKIRHRLEDANRNIYALSREGWALRLVNSISIAVDWRNHIYESKEINQLVQERFAQLRSFDADPNEIAANLRLQLEGPVPSPQKVHEKKFGFGPGSTSITLHSDNGYWKRLLPAYQYMRMSEDSGIPSSIGNSLVTGTQLKSVAEWLKEPDSARTQSLMFRLLDKKVTESYLSRHRIAALHMDIISIWRKQCVKVINDSLPNIGKKIQDDSDIQHRSRDRLKTASDILARTSVRATETELSDIWDLFIKLYKSEECRFTIEGGDVIRTLFDNLLQSSSTAVLGSKLRILFNLPIPGEHGFEVWQGISWPDPSTEVGIRLLNHRWKLKDTEWRGIANRLIELIKSDQFSVRTTALSRLIVLDRFKLLQQRDQKKIGQVFWSTVLQSDNLPFDNWKQFTLDHSLVWPPPKNVDAKKRVKRHLLQHQINAVTGIGDEGHWFDLLISFSDPGETSPKAERLKWNATAKKQIFSIIRNWWDTHGRKQAADMAAGKNRWLLSRDGFSRFIIRMWDVVREVLLASPNGNGRITPLILDLIREIEQAELPVGEVLPAVLRVERNELPKVASTLRKELTSGRDDFRLSALRGLVFWADAHRLRPSKHPILRPPVDLIRELGAAVAMRQFGDLRLLLNGANAILNRQGKKADKRFMDNLLIGLEYLFTEARYRTRDENSDDIPYEVVPCPSCELPSSHAW